MYSIRNTPNIIILLCYNAFWFLSYYKKKKMYNNL